MQVGLPAGYLCVSVCMGGLKSLRVCVLPVSACHMNEAVAGLVFLYQTSFSISRDQALIQRPSCARSVLESGQRSNNNPINSRLGFPISPEEVQDRTQSGGNSGADTRLC